MAMLLSSSLRSLAVSSLAIAGLVNGQALSSSSLTADGLGGAAATPSPSESLKTATVNGTAYPYAPIFTVPAGADIGANVLPNIDDPEAVDAQTVCPGYKASDVQHDAYGFSATLALAGEPCNVYGIDVEMLNLTVQYQSADRLSVSISPAQLDASNMSWYILPEELVPRPSLDTDANSTTSEIDLQVSWSNEPTFSFKVLRRSTGDVLFDTTGSILVYENQFIEFVTSMPENYNIYGLGEHIHALRLGNNFTATFYDADVGDTIDANIYGTHPFYLDTRYFEVDSDTGNMTLVTTQETNSSAEYISYSHGAYLRNAHGLEVLMRPDNITWRALGGSIDLYFFDGPTPAEVTKQYQIGAVGLPAMQQYFTFGYHQCRWGYTNWTELQDVVDNFAKFEIPLDSIWTDIDYMDQYRDFSTDPHAFPVPEGQAFLKRIHDAGLHYIPIVDSAIYIPNPDNASDAYSTYERGHDNMTFLQNPDGSEYIGAVWPGYTVFPDWQIDTAVPWWANELVKWHGDIPFDGIWIDMSEASSFCVGSCGTGNLTINPVHPPFLLPGEVGNKIYDYPEGFNITNSTEAAIAASLSSSQAAATATSGSSSTTSYLRTTPTATRNINHPPYVINNNLGDLAVHAVSPNATHFNGIAEYDVHNLWGYQILNATYEALLSVFPTKRPFIIGRSTFAGAGKWAGHWGGDNTSKWAYMVFSIPQALQFSLFGIPMFGVDTCGFGGNTDEELCSRWMQLSAFFPFYRNHNTLSANSQEPYVWASVAEAAKTAMKVRYALLPYIYTTFHAAHTTGSTVMRALAWEFPSDPALRAADRQFLLGPAIMVAPVLVQGATSVDAVFPGARTGQRWFDWYSGAEVDGQAGKNVSIDAPLGHIPVFVRGGAVVPVQEAALTTKAARASPWGVLVALDGKGAAEGELYVDDGESLVPGATKEVRFAVGGGRLYAACTGVYEDGNALANVTVMGVGRTVEEVRFNGGVVRGWGFDAEMGVLSVTGLANGTAGGAWDGDWVLSWE